MAGHTGNAVVEHDRGDRAAVVEHVQDAGHAGVEEGRVADHRAETPALLAFHTVGIADGGPYANRGVHRVERRKRAQRVASDVARNGRAQLSQRVEDRVDGRNRRRAPADASADQRPHA